LKKYILILVLFATITFGFAYNPTVIIGTAKFAANCDLRIYKYDDLLSYKRVLVTNTRIDKHGNFRVEIDLNQPSYFMFCINFIEGDFYAEPEYTYNVELEADSKYKNPIEISAAEVPMYVICKDSLFKDINSLINALDNAVGIFLSQNNNFEKIYFGRNIKTIDSLKSIIFDGWGENNGQYFRTYQKYTFANVDLIFRSKMTDTLFKLYIGNNEIYTENSAYMNFFNSFFNNYFDNPFSKFSKLLIQDIINKEADLFKISNELGRDPLLANEIIREIVLIKMLTELYVKEDFNQANIYKLLTEISKNSKFPEHRKMAANSIYMLHSKINSKMLIDFEFKNVSGVNTKISNFLGKYIYIQFFTTDCESCIRDMYGINKLKKTYGDSIEFISISVDVNSGKLFQFVNKQIDFNWQILHFNNDYDFIDNYQIKGLPYSIFLDKDGQIIANPALQPDEDLSKFFEFLLKEGKSNRKYFLPGMSEEKTK